MRIISKKTQWRLIRFIVARSENVRLSDFKGTLDEQVEKFDKYTKEVTNLVHKLGGMAGLVFLEKRCGISSRSEFRKEE